MTYLIQGQQETASSPRQFQGGQAKSSQVLHPHVHNCHQHHHRDYEARYIAIYNYIERNSEIKYHPLECIFSNMDIPSMAIHATISIAILKFKR